MKFKPAKGKVFVSDLERGMQRSKGGILITDDNMKSHGIKPRWGKIFSKGEDVTDIEVGQWVFIEHGRWSQGIDIEDDNGETVRVWHIDHPAATMVVSDVDPRTTERVERL